MEEWQAMKKIWAKIAFAFRFAFRNLFYFKIRSLIIGISFLILFVVTLLGLSTKPFIEAYYYGLAEEIYPTVDCYIGINENTNTRYFSVRTLNQSETIASMTDAIIPFFEISTLIEVNQQPKTYVKVMASTLEHLKRVAPQVNYSETNINTNQVIVTSSLQEQFQLSLNDTLTIYVGETQRDYTIVSIEEDGGLFAGSTIFLNKEESVSLFLSALIPDLGDLNPIFFTNLFNRVYFEVSQTSTPNQLMQTIKAIPEYANLDFKIAINTASINQQINRITALFSVVIVFIFFAVFLVMQTTFLMLFEDRRKAHAVVDILGGRKGYTNSVLFIEILIFFLVAFGSSIVITNQIINAGLAYMNTTFTYHVQAVHVLIAGLIIFAVFTTTFVYYQLKTQQTSTVLQSKERAADQMPPLWQALIALMVLVCSYIGVSFIQESYQAIIQTILIVLMLFLIIYIALIGVIRIMKMSQKWIRHYLQLKILFTKKSFYRFVSVILVCSLSLYLLVLTDTYMLTKMKRIEEEQTIDFAIRNLITRFDATLQEIKTLDQVKSANAALMHQSAQLIEVQYTFQYVVSVEPLAIGNYYQFPMDPMTVLQLQNATVPTIILPQRFNVQHGMQVGDIIHLALTPLYQNEPFVIGGFFESQTSMVAFTNMMFVESYSHIALNTILVVANGDSRALKEELIDRFSQHLIYIIDYEEIIHRWNEDTVQITEFISFIIIVIIACFLFSIFNHLSLLFEQMRHSYARMAVIGYSKRTLTRSIILEHSVVLTLIIICSIIGFIAIGGQLSGIILFFNEYEAITIQLSMILIGTLSSIFVFALASVFYLRLVRKNQITEVIRSF